MRTKAIAGALVFTTLILVLGAYALGTRNTKTEYITRVQYQESEVGNRAIHNVNIYEQTTKLNERKLELSGQLMNYFSLYIDNKMSVNDLLLVIDEVSTEVAGINNELDSLYSKLI